MKSYFAILADRATLADTLQTSSTHAAKAADPFEAAPPPAIPPSEVAKPKASSNEFGDLRLQPPQRDVRLDTAPAIVVNENTSLHEAPVSSNAITPNVQANNPSNKPIPKEETESEGQRGLQTKPTDRPFPVLERTKEAIESSILPLKPGPPQSKNNAAEERKQASEDGTAEANDRLADLERNQDFLLRKADAFMHKLLARRTESKEITETETPAEPQTVLKPDVQPNRSNRAQPKSSVTPLREDSDRRSLVIGKLTVEVMPPTPPPVTPEQRVVVVQSARSRTVGLISGKRFGLGQF